MDEKIKGAELSCIQLTLVDRQNCNRLSVLISKEETEQFYEVLQSTAAPHMAFGHFWLLLRSQGH